MTGKGLLRTAVRVGFFVVIPLMVLGLIAMLIMLPPEFHDDFLLTWALIFFAPFVGYGVAWVLSRLINFAWGKADQTAKRPLW